MAGSVVITLGSGGGYILTQNEKQGKPKGQL